MLIPSNAHTHSLYCDGKNSLEEMVLQALALGFTSLGFSGHSYAPGDGSGMSIEGTNQYGAEILALQEKYYGKIRIFLGIEQDHASVLDAPYEYTIGSVHEYFDPATGDRYSYDWTEDRFLMLMDRFFQGDPLLLAKQYYSDVASFINRAHPSIVGHFNLITKYNDSHHLYDEDDPAYKKIASKALLDAASTGAVCEINTGIMSRGYGHAPYLTLWMLKLLREHGYPVTVSSDCHNKDFLDRGFDVALDLAREAGYKSILILKKDAPLTRPLRRLGQEELFEEYPIV